MIETALSSGICSMGVDVLLVGPMPTPGIAFLTGSMRADAGVVISASHNPFQDNGIKFFSRDGFKLPDDEELGANVGPIAGEPDGENINRGCVSLHPEVVADAVRKGGCDLGIALDGDADRAIFVDERGEVVDGDAIMAICGLEML